MREKWDAFWNYLGASGFHHLVVAQTSLLGLFHSVLLWWALVTGWMIYYAGREKVEALFLYGEEQEPGRWVDWMFVLVYWMFSTLVVVLVR